MEDSEKFTLFLSDGANIITYDLNFIIFSEPPKFENSIGKMTIYVGRGQFNQTLPTIVTDFP
jgi:hypothetical protein